MEMTHEEIKRDYRLAKNKSKQVGILADLNGCKRRDIEKILGIERGKGGKNKGGLPPISADTVSRIIELHSQGMRVSKIAQECKCGDNTVRRYIKKHEEEKMIFSEDLTQQENELLLQELKQLTEPNNEQAVRAENADDCKDNSGESGKASCAADDKKTRVAHRCLCEVVDHCSAVNVASVLMDILFNELGSYIVEIKHKDGEYTIHVDGEKDEIFLRRKKEADV